MISLEVLGVSSLEASGQRTPVLTSVTPTQRTQYGSIKEHALRYTGIPSMIEAIFLREAIVNDHLSDSLTEPYVGLPYMISGISLNESYWALWEVEARNPRVMEMQTKTKPDAQTI